MSVRTCKYFANRENCPFGPRCRFMHSEGRRKKSKAEVTNVKTVIVSEQIKGVQQTCRFFLNSHCKYGDQCKYLHQASKENKADEEPFIVDPKSKQSGESSITIQKQKQVSAPQDKTSEELKPNSKLCDKLSLKVQKHNEYISAPPPLTLASFIRGVKPVPRPQKIVQKQNGVSTNPLREVYLFLLQAHM